jgi:hypothetical protein
MIDNTTLATTAIGLDAIRREQDLYDALVPQPRRIRKGRGLAIRLAIAQALRHLADSLEASQPSAGPSRA